jgi:hypothetical protein
LTFYRFLIIEAYKISTRLLSAASPLSLDLLTNLDEACCSQGFVLEGRVLGLQFQLETTAQSAAALIQNCGAELDGSKYVQSAADMLSKEFRFLKINGIMYSLLEKLEKQNI